MCKDKSKKEMWSKRYKEREDGLKGPAVFIENKLNHLNKGTVLDLACGDGRNSIFLAKQGFEVTGIDFSEEALKRLNTFSEMEKLEVATKVLDVDNKDELLKLGKFDNIVISNFKPTVQVFKMLDKLLNEEGIIIFSTFNFRDAEENDFPRKFCVEENEFKDVNDQLELVALDVFKEGSRNLDGYIFANKKKDL